MMVDLRDLGGEEMEHFLLWQREAIRTSAKVKQSKAEFRRYSLSLPMGDMSDENVVDRVALQGE